MCIHLHFSVFGLRTVHHYKAIGRPLCMCMRVCVGGCDMKYKQIQNYKKQKFPHHKDYMD